MTFSDPRVLKLLREDFVPVAIDQWYQRRQQDREGEFWRKIAGKGPRNNFELTTQGKYVASAGGVFLGYNNNRGPERLLQMMHRSLKKYESLNDSAEAINISKLDDNALARPKPDTTILRVNAKILGGYKKTTEWVRVFHDATSRDNMWIQANERPALIRVIETGGDVPARIAKRIARFHLVDDTRGEPPRWANDEVRKLEMKIEQGILTGKVHLETNSGDRGFVADLYGIVATQDNTITQFDVVAKGNFWGKGRYTYHAPKGKFPLAVAFRLADRTDPSDQIMPHGAKGWPKGYFESELH